jgi:hypothetical protein
MLDAIAGLSEDTEMACFTFAVSGGTDDDGLSLANNVKHGSILSENELNILYNSSKIGVLFSEVNDSLINLEMAAHCLSFVDLSTKNVSDTFRNEIYYYAKSYAAAFFKAMKVALISETDLNIKARNVLSNIGSKYCAEKCSGLWELAI